MIFGYVISIFGCTWGMSSFKFLVTHFECSQVHLLSNRFLQLLASGLSMCAYFLLDFSAFHQDHHLKSHLIFLKVRQSHQPAGTLEGSI